MKINYSKQNNNYRVNVYAAIIKWTMIIEWYHVNHDINITIYLIYLSIIIVTKMTTIVNIYNSIDSIENQLVGYKYNPNIHDHVDPNTRYINNQSNLTTSHPWPHTGYLGLTDHTGPLKPVILIPLTNDLKPISWPHASTITYLGPTNTDETQSRRESSH